MQALFNEKVALLDYHHKLHMQFTEYSLKQPSYEQVIGTLARIVDNPIALMDHQKNIVCSTDERMKQLQFLHNVPLIHKEMTFAYKKQRVLLEPNRTATQIVVEIPNIGNDTYDIAVADLRHEIRRLDYMPWKTPSAFCRCVSSRILPSGKSGKII